MKPYYTEPGVELYHGDSLDVLPTFAAGRFSRIITDPPYGLSFMGREWDHGIPGVPFWEAALRVCKPGATLMAFGGTRTFHRLTCAIEDAGWEIRDCLMWLYGSGFPKSLDVSKAIDKAAGAENVVGTKPDRWTGKGNALNFSTDRAQSECKITAPATDAARLWSGWGTALKPAWEPIIVAQKPLDGTYAENALRHGVAGLNINGARIACEGGSPAALRRETSRRTGTVSTKPGEYGRPLQDRTSPERYLEAREGEKSGRWPANVVLDEAAADMLNADVGTLTSGKEPFGGFVRNPSGKGVYGDGKGLWTGQGAAGALYGDSGGPSRFFYTAKASRADRGHGNDHPTVKPTDLIRYLLTLTDTPTHSEVLDLFGGSCTLAMAARAMGMPCVCIDKVERHVEIGKARLQADPILYFGGAA